MTLDSNSTFGGAMAQLEKWRTQFTQEDIGRMTAVLEEFGVERYTSDILPQTREQRSAPSPSL